MELGSTALLDDCSFQDCSAGWGGGAVFCSDTVIDIVNECTFDRNIAGTRGGALRIRDESTASVTDCDFTDNSAASYGGAIASSHDSDVTVTGCDFTENDAGDEGGGLSSEDGSATVSESSFFQNAAFSGGGGILSRNGSIILSDSRLEDNTTSDPNNMTVGAGMLNQLSTGEVTGTVFIANHTVGPHLSGGGMANLESPLRIADCSFEGNGACVGGGMHNLMSDTVITKCDFLWNMADSAGGIYSDGGSPEISWCVFERNGQVGVTYSGGGISLVHCQPVIHNCAFYGNEATWAGGGVLCQPDSVVEVANCLFSGNRLAEGDGAGIRAEAAIGQGVDVTLANCTFSRNFTWGSGGGVSIEGLGPVAPARMDIDNSIFWENEDWTGMTCTAQIHSDGIVDLDYDYSCVYACGVSADGNIDCYTDDPRFPAPNGLDGILGTRDDNLHLLTASSCVDNADNTAVPKDILDLDDDDSDPNQPIPLDLDVKERFLDDTTVADTGIPHPNYPNLPIVDMGSYERCPGDVDGDGDTDQGDLGELLAAWDSRPGDSHWNENADLDGDLHVHQGDLGVLLADWGCGT
jgi:predicted outer membrane repeat protein